MDISALIAIIGTLVALTNIVVEVVKKVTWNKIPTSILAVSVSEILTLIAGFSYWEIKALPLSWYTIVAFVVVGILVSYAAMFGFDKLKDAFGGNKDE